MNTPWRHMISFGTHRRGPSTAAISITLFLTVVPFYVTPVSAQNVPSAPALPPAVQAPQVPSLANTKSPVELFRRLLAMNPAEREQELANRSEVIRQRILIKLHEYEVMKPENRELRLRVTELRWNLFRLLPLAAKERGELLATFSESDRTLIGNRLQQWDQLPAIERQEVLKYEETLEQFAGRASDSTVANPIPPQPPAPDSLRGFNYFSRLPAEHQQELCASFQRFFELSDDEKLQTLRALPHAGQTSNSLHNLTSLPKAQRDQALAAIRDFSGMSEAERQQFVDNAQRWRALPPEERKAWRELINRIQPMPPLPPGMISPPPMPPLPALPVASETSGDK